MLRTGEAESTDYGGEELSGGIKVVERSIVGGHRSNGGHWDFMERSTINQLFMSCLKR